jgi:hypothetical protein
MRSAGQICLDAASRLAHVAKSCLWTLADNAGRSIQPGRVRGTTDVAPRGIAEKPRQQICNHQSRSPTTVGTASSGLMPIVAAGGSRRFGLGAEQFLDRRGAPGRLGGQRLAPRRSRRVAWHRHRRTRGAQVRRLGPNAFGEQLEPGRVADCYLGILLDQPLAEIAPDPGNVLVVAPSALLHQEVPHPDGQTLYELVTGHPDRSPRDLVFLADLTAELRAWPQQTWTAVGISPEVALLAVVDSWRAGHVKGLAVLR